MSLKNASVKFRRNKVNKRTMSMINNDIRERQLKLAKESNTQIASVNVSLNYPNSTVNGSHMQRDEIRHCSAEHI